MKGDKDFFKFCFGCHPSVISKTVIVKPFLPAELFKQHGGVSGSFKGRLYSGFKLEKNGKETTVVNCGMGMQLAGDAVLLLEQTKAQRIIFIGSCGGLKDSNIGDLIICESAFDGEGFSRYHEKDFSIGKIISSGTMIPADAEHTDELRGFLLDRIEDKSSLKSGDIFTIGSIMAENVDTLSAIEEKGFRGIDLELSAVYRAAGSINRKAAGLLFVGDLPLRKPLGKEPSPAQKKDLKKALEASVGFSVEFSQA